MAVIVVRFLRRLYLHVLVVNVVTVQQDPDSALVAPLFNVLLLLLVDNFGDLVLVLALSAELGVPFWHLVGVPNSTTIVK